MKKVEPVARNARRKAKAFLEADNRIHTLFELFDATVDAWSPDETIKSSRSVRFEILADGVNRAREICGVNHQFETCKFRLNKLRVEISKCHHDDADYNSLMFAMSCDEQPIFTVIVSVDMDCFGENLCLAENGTLESVEEFHFTPKLLEVIRVFRKLKKYHHDIEDDQENRRLNKRYANNFSFDGMEECRGVSGR